MIEPNGWVYKIVLMFYTPCYVFSKIKNIMKGKIEKVVNKNGDGGWFINNIPLHTDDIDKFVNYQNGKLIHKYENEEVEYYTEEFNHHFYGKLEVARLVV